MVWAICGWIVARVDIRLDPPKLRIHYRRGLVIVFAAWMLLLLSIAGLLAFAPPAYWWMLLIRVSLIGLAIVVFWSAYIDFCFFRHVIGASAAAAVRDVAVHRTITWLVVFSIFATQELTPWGLARELSEAVAEILR